MFKVGSKKNPTSFEHCTRPNLHQTFMKTFGIIVTELVKKLVLKLFKPVFWFGYFLLKFCLTFLEFLSQKVHMS